MAMAANASLISTRSMSPSRQPDMSRDRHECAVGKST
jgi:hypothetical protein